jgi:hypothetical protein
MHKSELKNLHNIQKVRPDATRPDNPVKKTRSDDNSTPEFTQFFFFPQKFPSNFLTAKFQRILRKLLYFLSVHFNPIEPIIEKMFRALRASQKIDCRCPNWH